MRERESEMGVNERERETNSVGVYAHCIPILYIILKV